VEALIRDADMPTPSGADPMPAGGRTPLDSTLLTPREGECAASAENLPWPTPCVMEPDPDRVEAERRTSAISWLVSSASSPRSTADRYCGRGP
jgi:hypothetical protein